MGTFFVKSPIDGQVVEAVEPLSLEQSLAKLSAAESAQKTFRGWSVAQRVDLCRRFLEAFDELAPESSRYVTRAMGKPLRQSQGEIGGMRSRTEALCAVAEAALADRVLPEVFGQKRFVRREPLGVVLDIAAWNYPYVVAINVVAPAVLAGNAVLIKHAPQTARVGVHFEEAFRRAGAPEALVQSLFVDHETAGRLFSDSRIAHVGFTGSVRGGREVYARVAAAGHATCGLEMGGKDPALVLDDADIEASAISLCDGAFYNAGQSCCAVERIYVPRKRLAAFVDAFVAETHRLKMGDPLDVSTSLGPVVNPAAARSIQAQVDEALSAGARQVSDDGKFDVPDASPCYLPPRVLVDVDHSMALMRDETFGPAIGIQAYDDLDEAIRLANDSPYGLTASVWSSDEEHAVRVMDRLEAGTVYMNRSDAVDPDLPWVGVKDSGLGFTLSRWGIVSLTRPKSYNLKTSS